jgi:hypothetical protein
MVSTLANAYGNYGTGPANDLMSQAFELACPIPDYEDAAIQAGWFAEPVTGINEMPWWTRHADDTDIANADAPPRFCNAQEACEFDGIEPYDREVFEHWTVSTWFAEKLIEQGEKVGIDFAGLNVWARTTTGQQISADGVIERIYAATHK